MSWHLIVSTNCRTESSYLEGTQSTIVLEIMHEYWPYRDPLKRTSDHRSGLISKANQQFSDSPLICFKYRLNSSTVHEYMAFLRCSTMASLTSSGGGPQILRAGALCSWCSQERARATTNGAEFLVNDRMGGRGRNELMRPLASEWLGRAIDVFMELSDVNGLGSRRKSFANALEVKNISSLPFYFCYDLKYKCISNIYIWTTSKYRAKKTTSEVNAFYELN